MSSIENNLLRTAYAMSSFIPNQKKEDHDVHVILTNNEIVIEPYEIFCVKSGVTHQLKRPCLCTLFLFFSTLDSIYEENGFEKPFQNIYTSLSLRNFDNINSPEKLFYFIQIHEKNYLYIYETASRIKNFTFREWSKSFFQKKIKFDYEIILSKISSELKNEKNQTCNEYFLNNQVILERIDKEFEHLKNTIKIPKFLLDETRKYLLNDLDLIQTSFVTSKAEFLKKNLNSLISYIFDFVEIPSVTQMYLHYKYRNYIKNVILKELSKINVNPHLLSYILGTCTSLIELDCSHMESLDKLHLSYPNYSLQVLNLNYTKIEAEKKDYIIFFPKLRQIYNVYRFIN